MVQIYSIVKVMGEVQIGYGRVHIGYGQSTDRVRYRVQIQYDTGYG